MHVAIWTFTLFYAASSLRIQTTIRQILTSLNVHQTAKLFEVLDISTFPARMTLLSILRNGTISLDTDYAYQDFGCHTENETEWNRAKTLVEWFCDSLEMLEIVVPFALYVSSPEFAQPMKAHLAQYRPKIIDMSTYFQEIWPNREHLQQILGESINMPERWTQNGIGQLAKPLGLVSRWDAVQQNAPASLQKQPLMSIKIGFVKVIEMYYRQCRGQKLNLNSRAVAVIRANQLVLGFLRKELGNFGTIGDYFDAYPHLLDIARTVMKGKSPVEAAMWNAKLLIATLGYYAHFAPTKRRRHKLCKHFAEFFKEHEMANIPPYLISEMLRLPLSQIMSPIQPDAKLRPILRQIDFVCPQGAGFWGGVAEYTLRWRLFLRDGGLSMPLEQPLCQICQYQDLLDWWGDYTKLKHALLTFSTDMQRMAIRINAKKKRICRNLKCVLETLSLLLSQDHRIMHSNNYGELDFNPISDALFCKVMARTIAVNILIRGKLGFKFSPKTILSLYEGSKEQISNDTIATCVAYMLSLVNINYMPPSLFLPKEESRPLALGIEYLYTLFIVVMFLHLGCYTVVC
jgi:hypothetical protein